MEELGRWSRACFRDSVGILSISCASSSVPFVMNAQIRNPAAVGATVNEFEMTLSENNQLIARSTVGGFDLQKATTAEAQVCK